MIKWNYSARWRITQNHFAVEIIRGIAPEGPMEEFFEDRKGPNHWNVYVYIYPDHPFHKPLLEDCIQHDEILTTLPLHGGATYYRIHCNEKGKNQSIQIGSDYDHLYDNRFSYYSNEAEATEVFNDAEQLLKWMEDHDCKRSSGRFY